MPSGLATSYLRSSRLSLILLAATALAACSHGTRAGDALPSPPEPRGDVAYAGAGASRGTALALRGDVGQGWITLFDGHGLAAWRGYRRREVPTGWRQEGSVLAFTPGKDAASRGDLITRDQYGDFELELDWRISPGGNSGVFYRGTEEYDEVYWSAPEMQVLDNTRHPDGRNPRTSAGSDYALYAPVRDVTKPVGEWNHVRIVARGPHIEHWLNGVKLLEYTIGSPDWKARVAASKFKDYPHYGLAPRGHIGIQDHGDRVWFRDIRVRPLGPVTPDAGPPPPPPPPPGRAR